MVQRLSDCCAWRSFSIRFSSIARLVTIGVKRDELADKLRQPLGELVGDNKIHSVGEERLLRYLAGPKK